MKLGLQEISWGYVGAKLAHEDDNAQVEFIRAFLKECKTWGTKYQIQQQLASVNSKLDTEEREALAMLSYDE